MYTNKSEKEIQQIISTFIENGDFRNHIEGAEALNSFLQEKNNQLFTPTFLIDFHLNYRYANSAHTVLESLENFDIVKSDPKGNISMDQDEKLYPDFLLHSNSTQQFIIGEVKSSKSSERTTINQLMGYAMEVKNHLPFIPDSEINLVIISSNYDAPLRHAVSAILLDTAYNILCLQVSDQEGGVSLNVYYPDSWTHIWQRELPSSAFKTVTLKAFFKDKGNGWNAQQVVIIQDAVKDLLVKKANTLETHGFLVLGCDENNIEEAFQITIAQLDPRVFISNTELQSKDSHKHSILAKYLKKNDSRIDYYSLRLLSEYVFDYLERFFRVEVGSIGNWDELMEADHEFSNNCTPFYFDSWGRIGEYHHYLFYHPSAHLYFFNAKGSLEYHNHPYNGISVIEYLRGNQIFNQGKFSAKDCYLFGVELARYMDNCKKTLMNTSKESVLGGPDLFYQSIKLKSAIMEVETRCNTMRERKKPYSFPLVVDMVSQNMPVLIEEYSDWFCQEFLGLHLTHLMMFKAGLNYKSDSETENEFELIRLTYNMLYYFIQRACEGNLDRQVVEFIEDVWLNEKINHQDFEYWEEFLDEISDEQLIASFS